MTLSLYLASQQSTEQATIEEEEHTGNYRKATLNLHINSLYKATKLFKCSNT